VQGYAQHGAELGLRSVVTAEGGVTRGGPRALIGRYLRLRLAVTAVVWIVVTAAVALVRPEQLGLMALALASLFLIALQLDWVPLVEGRAEAAAVPLLVRPGVFLILMLLWPRPIDAIDIAAAFVTGWLAASMVSLAMLGPAPPCEGTGSPPLRPTAMLRRGLGFGIITLLNQFQLSADLLAVGASLGAREAGVYALALAATTGISVFAHAGSQLALAQARRRGGGELLRMLAGALAIGLLATTTLVVAGPMALPWLAGDGFAPAGPLLIGLAPWLLLIHPTGILQSVLSADGKRRQVVVANIGLFIVLAPGLVGAAWSGQLWAFALARSIAELTPLGFLLAACTELRPLATGLFRNLGRFALPAARRLRTSEAPAA